MTTRVAMVQGAVWGVLWLCNGRSSVRNHHSQTCKTTSFLGLSAIAPPPPPSLGLYDCCRPV